MPLFKRFESFIRTHHLFTESDRIIVAVSGGVDSMVLLDLLQCLSEKICLMLAVAHVNHGLRGREADDDESFVRDEAQKRSLPFFSVKSDVRSFASDNKRSLEEAARMVRFSFLESLLARLRFDKIALGHQANDQAETILMHLLRGSGLSGLRGIRPKREHVVHPLLFADRQAVTDYAEKHHFSFREDMTNSDPVFLRNKIRLGVLKQLEETIRPGGVDAICRSGEWLAEVEKFLDNETDKMFPKVVEVIDPTEIILDIVKFLHYFTSVQKNVVKRILRMLSPEIQIRFTDFENILRLMRDGKSGSIVELGQQIKVIRHKNCLSFARVSQEIFFYQVRVGEKIVLSQCAQVFESELIKTDTSGIRFSSKPEIEYLDFDRVSGPLYIRSWESGDWFVPLGMAGKKKLHDFFIDEGVPVHKRKKIPILADHKKILWIGGLRIDDRFKITEKTKKILKVKLKIKNIK